MLTALLVVLASITDDSYPSPRTERERESLLQESNENQHRGLDSAKLLHTMFVLLVDERLKSEVDKVLQRDPTRDQVLEPLELPFGHRAEHLVMYAVVGQHT